MLDELTQVIEEVAQIPKLVTQDGIQFEENPRPDMRDRKRGLPWPRNAGGKSIRDAWGMVARVPGAPPGCHHETGRTESGRMWWRRDGAARWRTPVAGEVRSLPAGGRGYPTAATGARPRAGEVGPSGSCSAGTSEIRWPR